MVSDDETYAPFKLFEYDHEPGSYCLMLSDRDFGAVEEVFNEHDREAGGYGWADVALQLMRTEAPELEALIDMDPEAGMFAARGTDLAALRKLGAALSGAYHDRPRLGALVAAAPYEYD